MPHDSLRERARVLGIHKLRQRSRMLADGRFAGAHLSRQLGAGLEFAGHRAYVPGDDFRLVDQRSFARNEKLLIKQYQTETEKALWLVLDAGSTNFSSDSTEKSEKAPDNKFERAAILAMALARIAQRDADPFCWSFLRSPQTARFNNAPRSSSDPRHLERFYEAGESLATEAQALLKSNRPQAARYHLGEDLNLVAATARRSSTILLFTDLLDFDHSYIEALRRLTSRNRKLIVCQILTENERHFRFEGIQNFISWENQENDKRELEASTVRAAYLENQSAEMANWEREFNSIGATLLRFDVGQTAETQLLLLLKSITGRNR